jgi:hypothetical protein
MPSRKKAKGKLRKAKAAAAVPREREWEVLARWSERHVAIRCNHGSTLSWKVGDPLYIYMNAVESFQVNSQNLEDGILALFQEHEKFWNDTKQRKMAIEILLAVGTNYILRDDEVGYASTLAIVASVMENYDGNFNAAFYTPVVRDINVGGDRDCLRYCNKQISCSCLKEKYLDSKRKAKIGECFACGKDKRRASLKICGR